MGLHEDVNQLKEIVRMMTNLNGLRRSKRKTEKLIKALENENQKIK